MSLKDKGQRNRLPALTGRVLICVLRLHLRAEKQMVEGLEETLNLFHSFFCMIILISELSTALWAPLLERATRTKARDWFFLGAGWGDSDWWRWIISLCAWAENVLRPDANTPQGLPAPWVQTLQSSLWAFDENHTQASLFIFQKGKGWQATEANRRTDCSISLGYKMVSLGAHYAHSPLSVGPVIFSVS